MVFMRLQDPGWLPVWKMKTKNFLVFKHYNNNEDWNDPLNCG